MSRPPRGVVVVALGALAVSACGDTYIESSATTAPAGATTTTLAPIDPDAPLADLLAEIGDTMQHLDEQIFGDDHATEALARIEELWAAAEPELGAEHPDLMDDFEQALAYVRTGVDRKRPADASKAYKVWVDVAAALD